MTAGCCFSWIFLILISSSSVHPVSDARIASLHHCPLSVPSDTFNSETSLRDFKVMHLPIYLRPSLFWLGFLHSSFAAFPKSGCFPLLIWKKMMKIVTNYVLKSAFQGSWHNFTSVNKSKNCFFTQFTNCSISVAFWEKQPILLVMLPCRTKLLAPRQGRVMVYPAGYRGWKPTTCQRVLGHCGWKVKAGYATTETSPLVSLGTLRHLCFCKVVYLLGPARGPRDGAAYGPLKKIVKDLSLGGMWHSWFLMLLFTL